MALEQVFAKVGLNPDEFTPGELDAIEQEVVAGASVATAVHKCAPTKSRAETFTGGNYLWSRNSDGSFNLFDVPVFAKHVRKLGMKLVAGKDGEPKVEENVVVVDEKWLNHAIEINRSRLESGRYMGALHVRHHPQPGSGDEDKTEPAGRFVLKYVRPMLYDGTMVPVLYADFVKIPATIFERIKAGLLPYRSIESLPPKFEEIDSIALLDTETPWFRLPMLTPGEEIQREVYAATCAPPGSPLRGVATTSGHARAALCYFAGGTYSEKEGDSETEGEEKEMQGEDQEAGGDKEKFEKGEGPIKCDVCGLTHPDDGRHEDSSERAELGAEGEGDDTMGKILDVLTAIAKGQEAILKSLPGHQAPSTADPAAPVTEQGAKPSSLQSKAADEGRISALEANLDAFKREKEVKALVAKAMTDLCEYNLGPKAEEKLLEKALASKDAKGHIDSFVETMKEHGTKMPTPFVAAKSSAAGVKAFIPPATADLPEVVREYQAKGPEALEKALKAHELYLLCKEQGSIGGISEKEFIKYRVEPGYGAALKG